MIDCGALGALEKRTVSKKRPLFVWFFRRHLGSNGFFRFVMILVASSILNACGSRPNYHETELTIRGLQLYLAVLDEYKKEKAERAENIPFDNGDPLDPAVLKYIPPGTSFRDAVAILRAAHFKVWPPSSVQTKDGETTRHFVVESDLLLEGSFLVAGATACILLETDQPNPEPTTVKQGRGFIGSI